MTRTGRRHRAGAWIAVLVVAIAPVGCSRGFYRRQANYDVTGVVSQSSKLTSTQLEDFSIGISNASRLYDPYDPDKEPMPPDDPAAHQYMVCVDGKHGWRKWYNHGLLSVVDDGEWQKYLPIDENGEVVMDLAGAIQLGRLNSREYQQNLETLYLSALDVTFERFRFDAQFFGGNDTFYDVRGPAAGGSSSVLSTVSSLQRNKFYATGAELMVGLANSIIWEFAGSGSETNVSLLDFSLVQPLLREGGRPRVLETLTLSERVLLSNVRQMERYRRGFFTEMATGRNGGNGPQRRGGFFGGAGLSGFTGVGGGGFGGVGGAIGGGAAGGGAGTAPAGAGGYIGLLQNLQEIRNEQANVAGLRDSLIQLIAAYDVGRIDRFQVDLTRQQLYTAQSQLATDKVAFENSLDAFKVDMGLPPNVPIRVRDAMLDQFELIDTRLNYIQEQYTEYAERARAAMADGAQPDPNLWTQVLSDAVTGRERIDDRLAAVRVDFERLNEAVPIRRAMLEELIRRPDVRSGDVDPSAFDVPQFLTRVERAREDFDTVVRLIEQGFGEVERLENEIASGTAVDDATKQRIVDALTGLSSRLFELSLVQARARLDAISLPEVQITSREALEIARNNRRDWMNARSQLVDSWRLIEFNANLLEGVFNVILEGDIGTTGDNPLRFRGTTSHLRAGFEFDAPLTRLAERNNYRQSLIEYQQARRNYMRFEDLIYQGLRVTIRQIELDKLNLELRRAAVFVAIDQVDLQRLRLNQPPLPGQPSTFSDTFARDLISALTDLLNAQNTMLRVWTDYEVRRIGLDFDMETMQLDDRGMWIDPGPITAETYAQFFQGPCGQQQPADGAAEFLPGSAPLDDAIDEDLQVPGELPEQFEVVPGEGQEDESAEPLPMPAAAAIFDSDEAPMPDDAPLVLPAEEASPLEEDASIEVAAPAAQRPTLNHGARAAVRTSSQQLRIKQQPAFVSDLRPVGRAQPASSLSSRPIEETAGHTSTDTSPGGSVLKIRLVSGEEPIESAPAGAVRPLE